MPGRTQTSMLAEEEMILDRKNSYSEQRISESVVTQTGRTRGPAFLRCA